MAHFRAEVEGARGETSRQGTKNSGISVHIHGWDTGVRVDLHYDPITDKDQVRVYRTGGSHNSTGQLIAQWTEGEDTEQLFNPIPK